MSAKKGLSLVELDANGIDTAFRADVLQSLPDQQKALPARWNDAYSRIEMHLEALRPIEFEVSGRSFAMAQGETIHTENSHKFSRRSSTTLLLAGGWTPRHRWLDQNAQFSLILADATVPRSAP